MNMGTSLYSLHGGEGCCLSVLVKAYGVEICLPILSVGIPRRMSDLTPSSPQRSIVRLTHYDDKYIQSNLRRLHMYVSFPGQLQGYIF